MLCLQREQGHHQRVAVWTVSTLDDKEAFPLPTLHGPRQHALPLSKLMIQPHHSTRKSPLGTNTNQWRGPPVLQPDNGFCFNRFDICWRCATCSGECCMYVLCAIVRISFDFFFCRSPVFHMTVVSLPLLRFHVCNFTTVFFDCFRRPLFALWRRF